MTQKKDIIIFSLNILTLIYFSLMIIAYQFRHDTIALGVVRELLTIPFALGLLVLLFLSFRGFSASKYNLRNLNFYSLAVGVATLVLLFVVN